MRTLEEFLNEYEKKFGLDPELEQLRRDYLIRQTKYNLDIDEN